MKINYVKCKVDGCIALIEVCWNVNGTLVLDSLLKDKTVRKTPFVASHLSINKNLKKCSTCNYDFVDSKSYNSVCLVNHGDNSGCVRCPRCSTYLANTGQWHETNWNKSDLVTEAVPQWQKKDLKGFKMGSISLNPIESDVFDDEELLKDLR